MGELLIYYYYFIDHHLLLYFFHYNLSHFAMQEVKPGDLDRSF